MLPCDISDRTRGVSYHSNVYVPPAHSGVTPPCDDNGTVACAVKLRLLGSRAVSSRSILSREHYHEHAVQSWSDTQVKLASTYQLVSLLCSKCTVDEDS